MAKQRRMVITIDFHFKQWGKDPVWNASERLATTIKRSLAKLAPGIVVDNITLDRCDPEKAK